MNKQTTILDDLYRYGAWANRRLFTMCDGLTDEQLNEPRPIGFGSLRQTMFHILAADEIWLERWQGVPWRPFDFDAQGCSLDQIAARLDKAESQRIAFMASESADGWRRICEFKDSKGTTYRFPLRDLLLHVANHGIHHRSQALNFLRHFGRKAPGGLDYIFFRLAHPTVEQDAAVADVFRGHGLEINTSPGHDLQWDRALVRRYFDYADWANAKLLDLTAPLSHETLDRSRAMGMDTMRKTMTHILDAEKWWLRNWLSGPASFEKLPETTTVEQVRDEWPGVIQQRNRFIDSLDDDGAGRVVTVLVGTASVKIGVLESLVQLCGHGTHHRAQWVNMLRHSEATPENIDVIFWLRAA